MNHNRASMAGIVTMLNRREVGHRPYRIHLADLLDSAPYAVSSCEVQVNGTHGWAARHDPRAQASRTRHWRTKTISRTTLVGAIDQRVRSSATRPTDERRYPNTSECLSSAFTWF